MADISTQGGLHGAVDNLKDWISGTVGVVEDSLGDAVELLKGAVGAGAVFGEEARLKAKYASAQAESLYGSATPAANPDDSYLSGASRSATSLASQASKSGYSVASDASKSGYSAASVASASGSSLAAEASKSLASGAVALSASASSAWSVAGASFSSA